MTTISSATSTLQSPFDDVGFDDAQLEAYRHDLRGLFQWAADHDISVLAGAVRTLTTKPSPGRPAWPERAPSQRSV